MKQLYSWLVIFALSFILANCSSPIGGTLVGFDKQPVPNALVRLIVIDDSGSELESVIFTITDGDGHFDFGIKDSVGSSFVIEAVLPKGRLRGFACGDGSKTDLNPITDAFVKAIIYVTETEDERTLSDFSRKELRNIMREIEKGWDSIWEMDFTDTLALIDEVIVSAGNSIPDSAGGTVAAVPLASVETLNQVTEPNPVFETSLARFCPRDHYWIESSLFGFDILQDGAICKGESQTLGLFTAYGIAYQLRIEGDTFKDPVTGLDTGSGSFPGDEGVPSVSPPPAYVEDNREICFGPVSTMGGLSVTRKVYVPETGDFARYLEIFSNPTASDITINVEITGGLGLGEFAIYGTGIETLVEQSGDLIIGSGDNWAASISATPATPHPTVGYIWDGLSGSDSTNLISFPPANAMQSFSYWWENVTIPAGSTRVYMHYAYLLGTMIASSVESVLSTAYMNPNETGMSTVEFNSLQNFAVTRGNVTGESGSVPSFADLTITNETRPASMTMKARRDGGFSANIDTQTDEEIKVLVQISGVTVDEKSLSVQ